MTASEAATPSMSPLFAIAAAALTKKSEPLTSKTRPINKHNDPAEQHFRLHDGLTIKLHSFKVFAAQSG
jgi:hypothetical protein